MKSSKAVCSRNAPDPTEAVMIRGKGEGGRGRGYLIITASVEWGAFLVTLLIALATPSCTVTNTNLRMLSFFIVFQNQIGSYACTGSIDICFLSYGGVGSGLIAAQNLIANIRKHGLPDTHTLVTSIRS